MQYFHVSYEMDGNNGKKENKWGLESLTSTYHRHYKYYLSSAKMYLFFLHNMVLTTKGQEMEENVVTKLLDVFCEPIIWQ